MVEKKEQQEEKKKGIKNITIEQSKQFAILMVYAIIGFVIILTVVKMVGRMFG